MFKWVRKEQKPMFAPFCISYESHTIKEKLRRLFMYFTTKTMTLIGLFTALLCIVAPMSIPIPISPVPLSLASLVVCFSAYLLGWKKGMICCLLYFLIGIVGVPVFSGFSAGFSKLAGPTGGYLIGYFFLAFFTGFFAETFPNARGIQLLGIIIGTTFLYCFGTIWLAMVTNTTFLQAAVSAVIPFLPGDICKIVIVILLAPIIKRSVKQAQISA